MICARKLQKTYFGANGRVDAVDRVDLDLSDGEFAAIVGSSGSGKSTLMNLLGLLDRPDGGQYLLDGRDVSRLRERQLAQLRRELIGFVFQGYNLVPRMTAQENVELGLIFKGIPASRRRETARNALELVGLSDRSGHYPAQMSGGQQQRVAIARAIAGSPRLILADEPTGNLDGESTAQVMEIFRRLNDSGVTVLLITHDKEVAQSAERVLQIRHGRIVSDTGQHGTETSNIRGAGQI